MANTRNKKLVGATLASALLLMAGLGGCGRSESSETLVADAKQFIQKGDTKAAVIQLKNALLKNPSDVEARLTLGALYNDIGDPLSAEKEYRKAAELGAGPDKTVHGLATALMAQNQFQNVLDETAATSAGKAELLALRGQANLGLGKVDLAQQSYEQAVQANPKSSAALIGMARIALTQQDIEGAMRLADQAATESPNDPDVWMFKGGLLRAQGKSDEALAAYDQVLKVKPSHRSAHIEKAYIEIATGKFDAAKADIEAAKKAAPGTLMVLYTQALLEHTQGKHAAAKESLQNVLRVAPDHMPSVLLAGSVEHALGLMPQAERYLSKYVEAVPRNAYARKLLVATLIKLGNIKEAESVLAPLMAGADNDPHVLGLAGELSMHERDFGKATDYLERAAKIAPKAAAVRTSLAMSRIAQGDNAGAVIDLEESNKLDASSTRTGMLLVLTELRMKRFDKALTAVSAMEKQHPKDPMVQNLKGGVLMANGDTVGGRAAFEKALALDPTFFTATANLAELAMREKKPELAKKHFLDFLEKNSKSVQAMTGLAKLADYQKKPAEVTTWLEKAHAENPNAVAPAVFLGQHYAASGAIDKALVLARKLQVANPENPQVLDLLGKTQLAKGDKKGAVESYSKLVSLMPKSANAHFRLASVYAQVQDPGAAKEALRKALAIDPKYLDAHLAMAELAVRSGKTEEALSVARQLQKLHEKEAVGFLLEANLLQAQRKPALAIRPYEKALALAPTTSNLLLLYTALTGAGKGAEAEARLAKWQKEHKADLRMRMFLAERALAKKEYKEAIGMLEGVVQEAPANAAALNNLAWAYQQVKDPRALKTAEQAHSLASDAPAILDTLGHMLVEQGNVPRGVAYLQKAVRLAPDNAPIRYHLAQGLAKSGDKENARKELEKVMSNKEFTDRDAAQLLYKQL